MCVIKNGLLKSGYMGLLIALLVGFIGIEAKPSKMSANRGNDFYENKDNIVFKMKVAGFNADDIAVTVDENNRLCISGEREKEVKKSGYYPKNRGYITNMNKAKRRDSVYKSMDMTDESSFTRMLPLPCEVDDASMVKKVSNGMLTIILPKK